MIASALATAVLVTGSATGYSGACDNSSLQTASGQTVRVGFAANNSLPLGTWVEMRKPRRVPYLGIRYLRIMDRGGPGFVLDIWFPECGSMSAFGRRTVTFKVLSKRDLFRGKPIGGWQVVSARRGGKLVWRNR